MDELQDSIPSITSYDPDGIDPYDTHNLLYIEDPEGWKAFLVKGPETKTYREELKQLGGKWRGDREGWMFYPKLRENMEKYVSQVLSQDPNDVEESFDSNGVPIMARKKVPVIGKMRTNPYMWVKWKVYEPAETMRVKLSSDGVDYWYKIHSIEENKGIKDTVWIYPEDLGDIDEDAILQNTSMMVIVNGKWQVWGMVDEHNIRLIS